MPITYYDPSRFPAAKKVMYAIAAYILETDKADRFSI